MRAPACTCTTTSGKYCGTECEAMEKTPAIECSCGHAICMLSNWGASHTLRTKVQFARDHRIDRRL